MLELCFALQVPTAVMWLKTMNICMSLGPFTRTGAPKYLFTDSHGNFQKRTRCGSPRHIASARKWHFVAKRLLIHTSQDLMAFSRNVLLKYHPCLSWFPSGSENRHRWFNCWNTVWLWSWWGKHRSVKLSGRNNIRNLFIDLVAITQSNKMKVSKIV